jgi:peptide/nickel transport system permease protein
MAGSTHASGSRADDRRQGNGRDGMIKEFEWQQPRRTSWGAGFLGHGRRFVRTHLIETFALFWIAAVTLIAIAPGLFTPYGFNDQDLLQRLQGPSMSHWLGTDELGRDTLTRLLYGARVSMIVAVLSAAVAFVIGVSAGLSAGYFGGWVDGIIMRIIDGMMAFPGLILALGVVSAVGGGIVPLMFAIGIGYVPAFTRVTRGAVLAEMGKVYIEASNSIGASSGRQMWRHILPNIMSPLCVQTTVAIGVGIIIEASLSFLGVGIVPPEASWGVMLRASYGYLETLPILSIATGLTIMVTVMSFNFLGDGVRDWFDPRTRKGR